MSGWSPDHWASLFLGVSGYVGVLSWLAYQALAALTVEPADEEVTR